MKKTLLAISFSLSLSQVCAMHEHTLISGTENKPLMGGKKLRELLAFVKFFEHPFAQTHVFSYAKTSDGHLLEKRESIFGLSPEENTALLKENNWLYLPHYAITTETKYETEVATYVGALIIGTQDKTNITLLQQQQQQQAK